MFIKNVDNKMEYLGKDFDGNICTYLVGLNARRTQVEPVTGNE